MPSPIFFDMKASNNAARIRLWIKIKCLSDKVESRETSVQDMQSPEFSLVNPLKKVPAMICSKGKYLFESQVIMSYLEYEYADSLPALVPVCPSQRAFVDLLVRVHDLYLASPNCNQPGFSHTQGCLYLPPLDLHHPHPRAMDTPTRAAKLAEIWQQLSWVESQIVLPFMADHTLTHADLTWFPTCVFFEYLLPKVFMWQNVFEDEVSFPKLGKWYRGLAGRDHFGEVRRNIMEYWQDADQRGELEAIRTEVNQVPLKWVYP